MTYFWDTVETIPDGLGWTHYGPLHLTWLAVFVIVTAANCLLYRKLNKSGRLVWRRVVAALLLADEAFKLVPMIITGRFLIDYLPFHLCSINLFLIGFHAFKPGKMVDNFLYTVCIPGALAALLFPTWVRLPAWNYMLLHSFTVHILLSMYPLVLTVGGDIKPELKSLPKTIGLLACLAGVALVMNLVFDTNFMFLCYAEKGNPLYLFEQAWGSHLLGFPVLITAVVFVMFLPIEIGRRMQKKV